MAVSKIENNSASILHVFPVVTQSQKMIISNVKTYMENHSRRNLWCFASHQSNAFIPFFCVLTNRGESGWSFHFMDGRTGTPTISFDGDNVIVTSDEFGNAWGNGFAIVN